MKKGYSENRTISGRDEFFEIIHDQVNLAKDNPKIRRFAIIAWADSDEPSEQGGTMVTIEHGHNFADDTEFYMALNHYSAKSLMNELAEKDADGEIKGTFQ